MPDPARSPVPRTPAPPPGSPAAADARGFTARVVAAPDLRPARVVCAGAGVYRLVFVPGLATAAEVAVALAAVPPAAVFMGGLVGTEVAEADFVEFGEPGPLPALPDPVPWPGAVGVFASVVAR